MMIEKKGVYLTKTGKKAFVIEIDSYNDCAIGVLQNDNKQQVWVASTGRGWLNIVDDVVKYLGDRK